MEGGGCEVGNWDRSRGEVYPGNGGRLGLGLVGVADVWGRSPRGARGSVGGVGF